MNKTDFLQQLRNGLSALPVDEVDKTVEFYNEMIADRMDTGLNEEEAVASMEPVPDIIERIMEDTPLTTLVSATIKANAQKLQKNGNGTNWFMILLLILGFPLWFSLLAAAFCVILSVYIVIWAVVLSVWAVVVSFGVGALAAVVAAPVMLITGNGLASALLMLGSALVCTGLAVASAIGAFYLTKAFIKLTVNIAKSIKSIFIRRSTKQA